MVANRILQLDHMTGGRAMFGVGPGLLPSDAEMLGIPVPKQRDRMAESLDVILRLISGERITTLELDQSLRVTPSSALMGDLKALLGPGCLG